MPKRQLLFTPISKGPRRVGQSRSSTAGGRERSQGPQSVVSVPESSSTSSVAHQLSSASSVAQRNPETVGFHPSLPLAEATEMAKMILDGKECPFTFVNVLEMNRIQKLLRNKRQLTSDVYKSFTFLIRKDVPRSRADVCAGWVLCSKVHSRQCSVERGLLKCNPSTGNSSLKAHAKRHEDEVAMDDAQVKVPISLKHDLYKACAYACALGDLPLSFAEESVGMQCFTYAAMEIGRRMHGSGDADVADLLPCGNTVKVAVHKASAEHRKALRPDIFNAMTVGGAVTCDGLTQAVNGKKYFDFVVHFVDDSPYKNPTLRTHILFLTPSNGREAGVDIKAVLTEALYTTMQLDFDSFMENFTFVTDSANVMPTIVGASTSEQVSAWDHRWMPCVAHMLNTAMKNVMKEIGSNKEDEHSKQLMSDWGNAKQIIGFMRRTHKNSLLPDGFALDQEIETRFGTVSDVVEKFIKSACRVVPLLDATNTGCFHSIHKTVHADGSSTLSYLTAIVNCFKPIRHVQTQLEACGEPVICMVLPLLEKLKKDLSVMSVGGNSLDSPVLPETCWLAVIVLRHLEKMKIHDLWISACILHPGMKQLPFLRPTVDRAQYLRRGHALIRKMVDIITRKEGGGTQVDAGGTETSQLFCTSTLGSTAIRRDEFMSFVESVDDDDLGRYRIDACSKDVMTYLKVEKLGVLRYWSEHKGRYKRLYKVAFRILATPASSAGSERHFSAVNRIVTPLRNRIGDAVLADLTFLRSALDGFTSKTFIQQSKESDESHGPSR